MNYADNITKEKVKTFTKPTQGFLCPLKANKYALQFLTFSAKDAETKRVFHEQSLSEHNNEDLLINDEDYDKEILKAFDEMRTQHYVFPHEFFDSKIISTFLEFKVGDLPVKDLTLIENHYYNNELIAQYEFLFPFCAPNSVNTWEYIYEIPKLPQEYINDIQNGTNTFSDTFFFVSDELILHNKSIYEFN
jgi:hypothetical protein